MTVPEFSGKIGIERLAHIRTEALTQETSYAVEASILYSESVSGFQFDYLWYPNTQHRRLFVFFSGDALRKTNNPPVFQRWSWARHFPGSCLFVSDPSLYLNPDLGLAWYSGTTDFNPLPVISERVGHIAQQLGLAQSDIYAYGSSGGGFAALRFAALNDDVGALAINPQTSISAYKSSNVEKYYSTCFSGLSRVEMTNKFPLRTSLLALSEKLRGKRIVLAQNTEDTHHLKSHFTPFCTAMGVPADHAPDDSRLRWLFFTVEGGHKKAEDSETFQKIIALVNAGI